MREVVIGRPEQYDSFPAEVEIENKPYFLLKGMENGEGYRLLSRRCPHAGDTVELEESELVCPMHGWTFEVRTGRCHNVPSAQLKAFEVELREGRLVALLT